MSGFLLDTNIPSELTRTTINPRVRRWLEHTPTNQLYFSAVSLGEIHKGIVLLPAGGRRRDLEQWLEQTLSFTFAGRILPIDAATGPALGRHRRGKSDSRDAGSDGHNAISSDWRFWR